MTDDYEVVPYACRPDPWSHPHRLGVAGRRAGLETADPDRFRLLELGCGDGAHVVPIAARFGRCEVVAVERSALASGVAATAVEQLGFSNVRVVRSDLTALPDDLGTFDYVVAHGLYSWVSPPVREHLLRTCAAHLSPNGVAYVSYNAHPGAALRMELRELLLATAPARSPAKERVRAARRALDALAELLAGPAASESVELARLVDALRRAEDGHLLHDMLAPINDTFSLRSFLAAAARHGLHFLGDQSTLASGGVQAAHLHRSLLDRGFDWLVAESFCDLLRHRGLRRTLLARTAPAAPKPAHEMLSGLHLAAGLRPREEDPSLADGVPVTFVDEAGVEVTQERALGKAALVVLASSWPRTLAWDELSAAALRLLTATGARSPQAAVTDRERERLAADLVLLHQLGALDLVLGPRATPAFDPLRPRATALALFELSRHEWISTDAHGCLELDPFDRALLPLLDGDREPTMVTSALYRMVRDGRITILAEGGPVSDPEVLAEVVPRIVAGKLGVYAAAGALAPAEAGGSRARR